MTTRIVTRVRFPTGGCELFGRVLRSISVRDGYIMKLHVESGLLSVIDPKEPDPETGARLEAVLHTSRVDACYLAPEVVIGGPAIDELKAPPPKK